MAKAINAMEAKFIASYQLTQNPTESAINAGYSHKSAQKIGWQLLRKPKIALELERWKSQKKQEITKKDFIDMAVSDYQSLEKTEPNAPRFLDIAGKALGYIGANNDQKNATTINNLTQINISGAESQSQLWEMTRKLLGND